MTNAKQLFLRKASDGKPSLSQWWASVIHDDRFPEVMNHVMAHAFESGMSAEQMEGARRILGMVRTISDNEDTPSAFPNPGLHHRFDVPKKLPESPTSEKSTDKKA